MYPILFCIFCFFLFCFVCKHFFYCTFVLFYYILFLNVQKPNSRMHIHCKFIFKLLHILLQKMHKNNHKNIAITLIFILIFNVTNLIVLIFDFQKKENLHSHTNKKHTLHGISYYVLIFHNFKNNI